MPESSRMSSALQIGTTALVALTAGTMLYVAGNLDVSGDLGVTGALTAATADLTTANITTLNATTMSGGKVEIKPAAGQAKMSLLDSTDFTSTGSVLCMSNSLGTTVACSVTSTAYGCTTNSASVNLCP